MWPEREGEMKKETEGERDRREGERMREERRESDDR